MTEKRIKKLYVNFMIFYVKSNLSLNLDKTLRFYILYFVLIVLCQSWLLGYLCKKNLQSFILMKSVKHKITESKSRISGNGGWVGVGWGYLSFFSVWISC